MNNKKSIYFDPIIQNFGIWGYLDESNKIMAKIWSHVGKSFAEDIWQSYHECIRFNLFPFFDLDWFGATHCNSYELFLALHSGITRRPNLGQPHLRQVPDLLYYCSNYSIPFWNREHTHQGRPDSLVLWNCTSHHLELSSCQNLFPSKPVCTICSTVTFN